VWLSVVRFCTQSKEFELQMVCCSGLMVGFCGPVAFCEKCCCCAVDSPSVADGLWAFRDCEQICRSMEMKFAWR